MQIFDGFGVDTWKVPEVSGEDDRLEFRSGIHFYAAQRAFDFKMYGLVFTCK